MSLCYYLQPLSFISRQQIPCFLSLYALTVLSCPPSPSTCMHALLVPFKEENLCQPQPKSCKMRQKPQMLKWQTSPAAYAISPSFHHLRGFCAGSTSSIGIIYYTQYAHPHCPNPIPFGILGMLGTLPLACAASAKVFLFCSITVLCSAAY